MAGPGTCFEGGNKDVPVDCLWHKRKRGVAILYLLSYGLGKAVEKQVWSEKISHLVLDKGNEIFIIHLGGDAE